MTTKELINSMYPEITYRNYRPLPGAYEIRLNRGRDYARTIADKFRKCSDAEKVRCTEVHFTQGHSYRIRITLAV